MLTHRRKRRPLVPSERARPMRARDGRARVGAQRADVARPDRRRPGIRARLAGRSGVALFAGHDAGTKASQVGCNSRVMEFSPRRRSPPRAERRPDRSTSARPPTVWRGLRRRARRLRTTTPCYESVRKLVRRRARAARAAHRHDRNRARDRDATHPRAPGGRAADLSPGGSPRAGAADGSRPAGRPEPARSRELAPARRAARSALRRRRKGEGRLSAALDPGSQRWIW